MYITKKKSKAVRKYVMCMVVGLLGGPATLSAQERVEASVRADVVSHYIWRGKDKAGFSFQPMVEASWKGLSLKACGSAGLEKGDYQELNLGLSYKLGCFNVGVTDYWQTGVDQDNRYLYYDTHQGAHQFEANIGFRSKVFSLQAYTMFGGNDFRLDGKRAYSTYIELGVPFKLGGLDWETKVGMTPMESSGRWEVQSRETRDFGLRDVYIRVWDYGEGFSCCSATLRCTKDLDLGVIHMPVYAEVNTNPYLKKCNLLLGFSIAPSN